MNEIDSQFLSLGLHIEERPEYGRYVVTDCHFKSNEVILRESPLCISPYFLPPLNYLSCCFCLKETKRLRLCSHCKKVKYCSTLCQRADWEKGNHRGVCKILCHLPSHHFFLPLLQILFLSPQKFEEFLALYCREGDETISMKYDLLWYQRLCPLFEKITYENNFGGGKGEKPFRLFQQVLRRLDLNAFSYLQEQDLFEGDGTNRSNGWGCFLLASFFNHSCNPNCAYIFDGNQIIVHTIRAITPGDQLSFSYCPILKSFFPRQKRLMDSHKFRCECERCQLESQAILSREIDVSSSFMDRDFLQFEGYSPCKLCGKFTISPNNPMVTPCPGEATLIDINRTIFCIYCKTSSHIRYTLQREFLPHFDDYFDTLPSQLGPEFLLQKCLKFYKAKSQFLFPTNLELFSVLLQINHIKSNCGQEYLKTYKKMVEIETIFFSYIQTPEVFISYFLYACSILCDHPANISKESLLDAKKYFFLLKEKKFIVNECISKIINEGIDTIDKIAFGNKYK